MNDKHPRLTKSKESVPTVRYASPLPLFYPIIIALTVSGPTDVQILSRSEPLWGRGTIHCSTSRKEHVTSIIETVKCHAEGQHESSCDPTHTFNFRLKGPLLHRARLLVPAVVSALRSEQR